MPRVFNITSLSIIHLLLCVHQLVVSELFTNKGTQAAIFLDGIRWFSKKGQCCQLPFLDERDNTNM